jgi:hypothetical protein
MDTRRADNGPVGPIGGIRGEWNVLLNPAHPDFQKGKFGPAAARLAAAVH